MLDGNAAATYDWDVHKQSVIAAAGGDTGNYFGWHYPPPFLAVAAALALLPYGAAYFAWVAATFLMFAAALRAILAHRFAYLLAGAFPAVFFNAILGQNGFLTAALIGGALLFMERRPVLAGCCLGLLTYKPQFGILFPIVLIATGRWTVFFSAAATGAAMALLSVAAFGTATWEAFLRWLPVTSQAVLSAGQADWAKLQSLYALVRTGGGSEALGWSLMAAAGLLVVVGLCVVWRSRCAYDLKAAALAAAVLLLTPYAFSYDLVILAVAVAFFVRHVTIANMRGLESFTLTAMAALIAAVPFIRIPVGALAAGMLAALILLRWREAARNR